MTQTMSTPIPTVNLKDRAPRAPRAGQEWPKEGRDLHLTATSVELSVASTGTAQVVIDWAIRAGEPGNFRGTGGRNVWDYWALTGGGLDVAEDKCFSLVQKRFAEFTDAEENLDLEMLVSTLKMALGVGTARTVEVNAHVREVENQKTGGRFLQVHYYNS